jgi:hypothetical protein
LSISARTRFGPRIRDLANVICSPPAPSQAIRGVLGKFADLPQEAEDEIRGLDEARRRVAELEREINRLTGASAAPQIDDRRVIERAVRSAVERERAAWRRKLEEGRAHLRKMIGATASAEPFYALATGEAAVKWSGGVED